MTNTRYADKYEWTPEMSQQLHEEYKKMIARREAEAAEKPKTLDFCADVTVGSFNVAAFNSNIEAFSRAGLAVTWDAFSSSAFNVSYRHLQVSGPEDLMRQFWNWYRGFFHIA